MSARPRRRRAFTERRALVSLLGMTSRGRLFKELKEQRGSTREADITLVPDENNIYRWAGYLQARASKREGLRALLRRCL